MTPRRGRAVTALLALVALWAGVASTSQPAVAALAFRAGIARTTTRDSASGTPPCAVLPPSNPGTLRFGERVAAAGPWIAIAAPTSGDDAGSPGEVIVGRLDEISIEIPLEVPDDIPDESRRERVGPRIVQRPQDQATETTEDVGSPAREATRHRSTTGDDRCATLRDVARLRSHASFDHFGSALALGLLRTATGPEPLLMVGRDQADADGIPGGAVDVFRRDRQPTAGKEPTRADVTRRNADTPNDAATNWRHEATLTATSPQAGAEFGAAIALAAGDPSIVAIGAPRADVLGHFDAGCVEIFRRETHLRPSAPSHAPTGTARGFRARPSMRSTDDGSSDAAREPDVRWRRIATVRSEDPQASAWFGRAIATDGRWLAIGAPGTDVLLDAGVCMSVGVVFLYRIESQAVVPVATIIPPAPCRSMWFGSALAIDDGLLLVGAPGAEIADVPADRGEGTRAGLAFLYELAAFAGGPGDPPHGAPLVLAPPSIEAGAGFGQSVALGAGLAVVGAPGVDGVRVEPDGSDSPIEDAGQSVLFELPWRGTTGSGGALAPAETLVGPSLLPMSLFATHATITALRPGGPVFTATGHLYVEEEAYGPSPGVALHRIR